MKHHRTHKRRHHSKRKTSRRVHRRRTHRRRGGLANPCADIRSRLINMRENLNGQSANTIEDFVGEVRALYDEAQRKGCPQNLLNEIEEFENGPVNDKTAALLGVNNNVVMN